MPRIAVVGSANMDLVVQCESLPRPGETVSGKDFATFPGGKGANQAVAAGRLGGEVFFVGCVGRDAHGEELTESLVAAGVGVEFLKRTNVAPTGTALITVDAAGENTIVIDAGANELLDPEDVGSALAALAPDIVLVQQEIPESAILACAGQWRLVLDPAPVRLLDPELYPHVEIVTPNESEALALTGIAPLDEFAQVRSAQALLEKGVRSVVLKLGARGAFFFDGRKEFLVPAPSVNVVDTTAAGDAFNGALAVALAEGQAIDEALVFAVHCASLSATRRGAQASMPNRSELRT